MSKNQQFETEIDAGIPTAQRSETGVPEAFEKPQVSEVPQAKQQVQQAKQQAPEKQQVPVLRYTQWVKHVQTPEGRLPHNVERYPTITRETLPPTEAEFWDKLIVAWREEDGKSNQPRCVGTYNGTVWNCAGKPPGRQMNCNQCREAHARFMMDGCQPAMNY